MQSKGKSMEIIPGIDQNALSGRKVFIEKEKNYPKIKLSW